jgi:transcription initiation factor IIF auxiliary subunit
VYNTRGNYSNNYLLMPHRWCMYLSLENDKKLTEQYIEKVVYHLHPCYVEKRIEIRSHPYLLSRTVYG